MTTHDRLQELERFSDRMLSGRVSLETLEPRERQIRWEWPERR